VTRAADAQPVNQLLVPFSWAYRAGVAAARARRVHTAPGGGARVISVGNLEAGGNGKTPFAMLVLEELAHAGKRAAYVSRGFGSRAAQSGSPTRVAGVASPVRLQAGTRVVSRTHPFLATEIGDEAALVAERCPQADLLLSSEKARAVTVARAEADVVVVDDALQSWRVPRHVDVVMLDALRPLGNGRLLPAGRLRELPGALERAQWVVFNGAADAGAVMNARERVARWLRTDVVVGGLARRLRVNGIASGAPVLLASGIARPESFERAVRALGFPIAGHRVYRDHHRYGEADAQALKALADASQATLLTTEKDAVKLRALGLDCAVARLDVEWVGESALSRVWGG